MTEKDKFSLVWSVNSKEINILKKLLKDDKFDPTYDHNWAIRSSYKYQYHDITRILLNDNRVRTSLKKELPKLFSELIEIEMLNKITRF